MSLSDHTESLKHAPWDGEAWKKCKKKLDETVRQVDEMNTNGIVQKLWNYCNVLRDDGLSYGDYVEQLTVLLFLKMAGEEARPPFNRPAIIPKDPGCTLA